MVLSRSLDRSTAHDDNQNGFSYGARMARSIERQIRAPFLMLMTGLFDFTMRTSSSALDGLTHRAKVRADNIANAETPGYRARRVDFEMALREAGSDLHGVELTEALRDNPVDERGNSVNLEQEVTEMVQDNLMFQAMVNGFNYKANLLRTAMGS